MGLALQSDLLQLDQFETVLSLAAAGKLTRLNFARLYRSRREHRSYLKTLLVTLEADDRKKLILHLCRHVNARMQAPRFVRKQKLLEAEMVMEQAQDEARNRNISKNG